jgi:hypothetical protein
MKQTMKQNCPGTTTQTTHHVYSFLNHHLLFQDSFDYSRFEGWCGVELETSMTHEQPPIHAGRLHLWASAT